MKNFSRRNFLHNKFIRHSVVFYICVVMCAVSRSAYALDVVVQGDSVSAGQAVDIILNIENNTDDLYGAEITLQWDSSALIIDSVENGTLAQSAGLNLFANTGTAGRVRSTQYRHASAFSDAQGQMLILHGTVPASAPAGDYPLTVSVADFINDQVEFFSPDNITHGMLTVTGSQSSGDLNNDGTVNMLDLTILIAAWGTADPQSDINQDGTVNMLDLTLLISQWGPVS